jgi:hypothetical protein
MTLISLFFFFVLEEKLVAEGTGQKHPRSLQGSAEQQENLLQSLSR